MEEIKSLLPLTHIVRSNERTNLLQASLCVVCQKNEKHQKLVLEPKNECFKKIIEFNDASNILPFLQGETVESLKCRGISYHSECYKKISKSHNRETKRKQSIACAEVKSPSERPLTRSAVSPFDKSKCLICQKDSIETLHQVRTLSRDEQLRNAFEIAPRSMAEIKVRCEVARDAHAGDIQYHTTCWQKHIIRAKPEIEGTQYDDQTEVFKRIVLNDVVNAVQLELARGAIIDIRNLVNVYDERLLEVDALDTRTYSSKREMIKSHLKECIPDVRFQDSVRKNEPQRIFVNDVEKFALEMAIKASEEDKSDGIEVARRCARILRRALLKVRKSENHAAGNPGLSGGNQIPGLMTSFMSWLLAGEKDLTSIKDLSVCRAACTISNNIIFNMRSDRQVSYLSKHSDTIVTAKKYNYETPQHIGMGLALHQYSRNKRLLELVSSPGFGYSISYEKVLQYETGLANAVIEQLAANGGVYIPQNMRHNVLPTFHLDNIDFAEDTKNGQGTTHALNLVVFQQSDGLKKKSLVCLPEKSDTLKLMKNSFSDLEFCTKPNKKDFQRTDGCSQFFNNKIATVDNPETLSWLLAKSMEFFCLPRWRDTLGDVDNEEISHHVVLTPSKDKECQEMEVVEFSDGVQDALMETVVSESPIEIILETGNDDVATPTNVDTNHIQSAELESDERFHEFRKSVQTIDSVEIPGWGASNSLRSNKIEDRDLTNIFNLPLIPGPASDFSAIFTALKVAHGISSWTCGETAKTVISLDLDLYEKIYLLVNSNENLRNKYVICLGELHIVFAYLRAIGTYIENSGIDDAWVKAKWFSENTVRQVLYCSHMKRALQAHESTLVALQLIYLRAFLKELPDALSHSVELVTIIKRLRTGSKVKDKEVVCGEFIAIEEYIKKMGYVTQSREFEQRRSRNFEFQFILNYMHMVTVLLKFIFASRSKNWKMHLSSVQDMIPGIISMDRIKYRRMLPVYLADMTRLEIDDPAVWSHFEQGNFSIQKTKIPFTAIGRDHAGEQQNKVVKIDGGLKGITKEENARTRYFLIAPILKDIVQEMKDLGGVRKKNQMIHHQLNHVSMKNQTAQVESLLDELDKVGFSMEPVIDESLYNIVTGRIFPNENYEVIINIEKIGNDLYQQFVEERLSEDSKVEIMAPLKKVNVPVFKKCSRKVKTRSDSRNIELKEHCNLFAKCAIISTRREIDMSTLIGNHELSSAPRSFFDASGNPYHGGTGKSKLVHSVLKEVPEAKLGYRDFGEVQLVVVDAMQIVQKLGKDSSVTTFSDLCALFIRRVNAVRGTCPNIAVAFDTYKEKSLKYATRDKRKGKQMPVPYIVHDNADISSLSLKEILGHENTKRHLSIYFMNHLAQFFDSIGISYVIAGNGETLSSFSHLDSNNHEEADSLMIHCIYMFNMEGKEVMVYSNDTDVFVLLIAHFNLLRCHRIGMVWAEDEYLDISRVHSHFGLEKSKSLLSFHCITGCDTVEKFNGISKETWISVFRNLESPDLELLNIFPIQMSDDVVNGIEKIICKAYVPKTVTITKVQDARWYLFRKNPDKILKLPPTRGALIQHLRRAFIQAMIWNQAIQAHTTELDPISCGWVECDGNYAPQTTENPIAPDSILDLIFCGCKGNCSTNRCRCSKSGQACTDFCQCKNEVCENTDPDDLMIGDDEEESDAIG